MTFKDIFNKLTKSLEQLEKLFNSNNKLNNNKYTKEHNDINSKLNLLYNELYNIFNISYHQLPIIENEKDKTIFLEKRIYFTNKLNKLKKELILLKEKQYPWPWNDIDLIQNPYIIPNAKKSMELLEIKYINNISIRDYNILCPIIIFTSLLSISFFILFNTSIIFSPLFNSSSFNL